MSEYASDRLTPTSIHLRKEEALDITWADGHRTSLPLRFLRKHCPCAGCKGERDLLGRELLPVVSTHHEGPITALGGAPVGNYALRVDWSDGHSSGIYTFAYLRELDELYSRENAAGH